MTVEEKQKLEEEIAVLEAELDKRYAMYHQMCEKHRVV